MLMKFFLSRYKIGHSLTLNINGINVFKNIKADPEDKHNAIYSSSIKIQILESKKSNKKLPKRNINLPLPSWALWGAKIIPISFKITSGNYNLNRSHGR